MRVVAVLAVRNEARFIRGCIEHLAAENVEVYVIDNESTDDTRAIVQEYVGSCVIGVETLPYAGVFSLRAQLRRKEALCATIDADWFMHVDADEIHQAPGLRLRESFARSEAAGYNAVNFIECTFIPTAEQPHHDHPHYRETMRWYYPFVPAFPHRLNAWKRQPVPVDLTSSGGHLVCFDGLRMDPRSLVMRHYLFLSGDHAVRKYQLTSFDPAECADGWHGWRASVDFRMLQLPGCRELRESPSSGDLDCSNPWQAHYVQSAVGLDGTKTAASR
jgi:glycosyltransferase involved in cell wall biosynthesis